MVIDKGLRYDKGHWRPSELFGYSPLFGGTWPAGDYFHYLHHKHVSRNFGAGTIPWDWCLGRFYNGVGPHKTREDGK